jgi:hypothetical protein
MPMICMIREPPAAITHAHAHAVRRDGCGYGDPPVLRQACVDDAVGDELRDHQHDVLEAQLIEVPGDEADPATGFPRGGVISIQLERMAILRRGHGHGFEIPEPAGSDDFPHDQVTTLRVHHSLDLRNLVAGEDDELLRVAVQLVEAVWADLDPATAVQVGALAEEVHRCVRVGAVLAAKALQRALDLAVERLHDLFVLAKPPR